MAKSPAFQFYPDSWLGSSNILCMTPAEEGAYIHLLCIAWNTDDCSLPDDDQQLSILSRLDEGWFGLSAKKIRKCFIQSGGKLCNERLLREREKQRLYSLEMSKASKKRWNKPKSKHSQGIAKAKPTESSQSQSQSISQSISQSQNSPTENSASRVSPEPENKIKPEYGNKEVNQMLLALRAKIGIQAFVDSRVERFIAAHCVNLMEKIGVQEFGRRLDILLNDSFHHNNCNKIKYVYNQIKGWIEPKTSQKTFVL